MTDYNVEACKRIDVAFCYSIPFLSPILLPHQWLLGLDKWDFID